MKRHTWSGLLVSLILLVIIPEKSSKSCHELPKSKLEEYINFFSEFRPTLQPDDFNYKNASLLQNRRLSNNPGLIVNANNFRDVRRAVYMAGHFGLKLAIQGTRHSYVGRSPVKGGVLLVSKIDRISVKLNTSRSPDGEVTVGTGVTWSEVYKEVDKYNRVVVGGADPSVGVGDNTLGGGYGPLTRSLGLAVDNLLEATLIVAEGHIMPEKVTVSAKGTETRSYMGRKTNSTNTDLFWALRGGGGGTFGVVVSLTFKLHQPPNRMFATIANFPMYTNTSAPGTTVLKKLYQYTKTLDNNFGGYFIYNTYPQSPGNFGILKVILIHYGAKTPVLEKQMTDMIANFGVSPIKTQILDYKTFWEYQKGSPPDLGGSRFYLYNALLQNDTDFDALVDVLEEQATNTPSNAIQGCTNTLIGGAMNKMNYYDTSISPGFRSATHSLSCYIAYSKSTQDSEVQKAGQRFGNQLKKFGKAVYFNEPTQDMSDWKEQTWGINYFRLLQIKNKWDPKHLFWCWNCVGSDLPRKKYLPICVSSSVSVQSWSTLMFVFVLFLI